MFKNILLHTAKENLHEAITDLLCGLNDLSILKLTFFISIESEAHEKEIRNAIDVFLILHHGKKYPDFTLVNQEPLNSKMSVEVYGTEDSSLVSYKSHSGVRYAIFDYNETYLFLSNVRALDLNKSVYEQSNEIFWIIESILKNELLPINSIQRQWNYIPQITQIGSKGENYQQFNDSRSSFYSKDQWSKGYPSATGIGVEGKSVVVSLIAVRKQTHITVLDNSAQIEAHKYSQEVLKENKLSSADLQSTPKFERGKLFGDIVWISGTAAIGGEKSYSQFNAKEQTRVTFQNISNVIKGVNKERFGGDLLMRIYLKNKKDFEEVQTICDIEYPKAQKVYLLGDVCRPELLVEIEMTQPLTKMLLITYEHVLGATLAQTHLKSKGIIVNKDHLPQEGNAKLWVEAKDWNRALAILEEWKVEVRTKWKAL